MIAIYIAIEERREEFDQAYKRPSIIDPIELPDDKKASLHQQKTMQSTVNQKENIFSKENDHFQVSMMVLIHSWKRFRAFNEKKRLSGGSPVDSSTNQDSKIEDILG